MPTITRPLVIRSAHAKKRPVSIRVNVARLRMFPSRGACVHHGILSGRRSSVIYICWSLLVARRPPGSRTLTSSIATGWLSCRAGRQVKKRPARSP